MNESPAKTMNVMVEDGSLSIRAKERGKYLHGSIFYYKLIEIDINPSGKLDFHIEEEIRNLSHDDVLHGMDMEASLSKSQAKLIYDWLGEYLISEK